MEQKQKKFEVYKGERQSIKVDGTRVRRQTILVRLGKASLSKNALILGLFLIGCQILDGIATYLGLSLMGVHMEGNRFLRELIQAYGAAPVLFGVKFVAAALVVPLIVYSDSRPWFRPVLVTLICIYLLLAVIPWTYLISQRHATDASDQTNIIETK